MFKISNYYDQSKGLPVKNSYQHMLLRWSDASTLLREVSKIGTLVGLVCFVASAVFNFDHKVAVTFTAFSTCSWFLFRTCSRKLEPQARDMLQYFKDLRDGKEW